jgi:hypothetical protein
MAMQLVFLLAYNVTCSRYVDTKVMELLGEVYIGSKSQQRSTTSIEVFGIL